MLKMRKHFLLACQLGVLGILVVWHIMLGLGLELYWKLWWWDIIAHMLGGLWVALGAAWVAASFGQRISILNCVLAALGVGIAWEVFEYVNGLQGSPFMSIA